MCARLRHSLLIVLIGIAACIICLFVAVAGPDQFRRVPKPPNVLQVSTYLPKGHDFSTEKPKRVLGNDVVNHEDESEEGGVEKLSGVPVALHEAIRKRSRAFNSLSLQMNALAQDSGGISYQEAMDEWIRLQKAYTDSSSAFHQEVRTSSADPLSQQEVKSSASGDFKVWSKLATESLLSIAVAHEQWEDAAGACWVLGGNGPDHDDIWWDQEVYYLQRAGLRGRAKLAFRSFMPLIHGILRPDVN